MTITKTTLTRALFGSTALLLAIGFILPGQANAALLTSQLDLGATGANVTSLQTFLAASASIYPEGIVSGYFGSMTSAAVARFQTANGLASVGRVGPATLLTINAQMTNNGMITTGYDDSAPIMYTPTITSTSNSATFAWSTNESAHDRVMFGTTWPFLYATAQSVTANGYGTNTSITVNGLQAHSQYYYVLESVDASGNTTWTVGHPVNTQNQ